MASLDDILTACKNNVIATNGIVQQLIGLYNTARPTSLYQGQLPTSAAVLYTASSEVATQVTTASFCNTTGGALNYYLYIVPSGASPAAANAVLFNVPLSAGTPVLWQSGLVIPAGATLQGYASGAGVTLTVAGRKGI